jgi:dihydrodipicolinate synthase/N-acetylneuraminate lyase
MSKTNVPVPARGVYAALATPRRPNSIEADAGAALEYVDKVCAGGVDGLVLFGSTGEFVHFDVEERKRLVSLAVKRSRVPALINVSHSTLAGAVEMAEQAIVTGAAGILVMPPYFYRYGDDEILQFYEAFVEALDGQTPIYLYNLPIFTNPISQNLCERLLGSGAFAGIKDSSGEWEYMQFLRALRDRHSFQLLAGNESIYLRSLLAGADGIVSGVAAAVPELLVGIQKAVRAADIEIAEALNSRLNEFLAWIAKFPATVGIKQAAEERGWMGRCLANPLGAAAKEDLRQFRDWFQAWLPETLAQCAATASMRS